MDRLPTRSLVQAMADATENYFSGKRVPKSRSQRNSDLALKASDSFELHRYNLESKSDESRSRINSRSGSMKESKNGAGATVTPRREALQALAAASHDSEDGFNDTDDNDHSYPARSGKAMKEGQWSDSVKLQKVRGNIAPMGSSCRSRSYSDGGKNNHSLGMSNSNSNSRENSQMGIDIAGNMNSSRDSHDYKLSNGDALRPHKMRVDLAVKASDSIELHRFNLDSKSEANSEKVSRTPNGSAASSHMHSSKALAADRVNDSVKLQRVREVPESKQAHREASSRALRGGGGGPAASAAADRSERYLKPGAWNDSVKLQRERSNNSLASHRECEAKSSYTHHGNGSNEDEKNTGGVTVNEFGVARVRDSVVLHREAFASREHAGVAAGSVSVSADDAGVQSVGEQTATAQGAKLMGKKCLREGQWLDSVKLARDRSQAKLPRVQSDDDSYPPHTGGGNNVSSTAQTAVCDGDDDIKCEDAHPRGHGDFKVDRLHDSVKLQRERSAASLNSNSTQASKKSPTHLSAHESKAQGCCLPLPSTDAIDGGRALRPGQWNDSVKLTKQRSRSKESGTSRRDTEATATTTGASAATVTTEKSRNMTEVRTVLPEVAAVREFSLSVEEVEDATESMDINNAGISSLERELARSSTAAAADVIHLESYEDELDSGKIIRTKSEFRYSDSMGRK